MCGDNKKESYHGQIQDFGMRNGKKKKKELPLTEMGMAQDRTNLRKE